MTLRGLVVGLGNIGMGYDLDSDPRSYVLTHARAFQAHPDFDLVGGVDSDERAREMFAGHYAAAAYSDIATAIREARPDVVAVAAPTALHASVVGEILRSGGCRAILCEKPLSLDVAEARRLVEDCRAGKVELFVNYMRRCDPGVAEIKKRIADGRIRPPVKGVVWYSKGMFNNGSHFVNLLEHWLGPAGEFETARNGRLWDGVDPEPDGVIAFAAGRAWFLAAREERFSHYTVELIAENGRLRYDDGGARITWQEAVDDAACAGYRVLDAAPESIPSDLNRIQWHVAEHLSAQLSGGASAICSGEDALRTLESLRSLRTVDASEVPRQ